VGVAVTLGEAMSFQLQPGHMFARATLVLSIERSRHDGSTTGPYLVDGQVRNFCVFAATDFYERWQRLTRVEKYTAPLRVDYLGIDDDGNITRWALAPG